MKKILVVITILITSFSAYAQVSSTKVVRIANSTTTFSDPLSEGNIVVDLDTDKTYLLLKGVAGSQSLSTLSATTDYKELAVDLSGGTSTLTVSKLTAGTIDVNALNYTNTYFDDLQVSPYSAKLSANNAPTWFSYKGAQVLGFEDAKTEQVFFTVQLRHQYKEGTDLHFHLHVVYADGNTGNVDWTFTYSWANVHGVFPPEATINMQTPASGSADYNTIASIGDLSGTGKKMSSILICSLQRNGTAVTDTYANSVYVLSMDFHMEMDKPGSDNQY